MTMVTLPQIVHVVARDVPAPVRVLRLRPYRFLRVSVPVGLGVRFSWPSETTGTRLHLALTNHRLFQIGEPDPGRNELVVTSLYAPGHGRRADMFVTVGRYELTVELTAVARADGAPRDIRFVAPAATTAAASDATSHGAMDAARAMLARYLQCTRHRTRLLLESHDAQGARAHLRMRLASVSHGCGVVTARLSVSDAEHWPLTVLSVVWLAHNGPAQVAALPTRFVASAVRPDRAQVTVVATSPGTGQGLLQVTTTLGVVSVSW